MIRISVALLTVSIGIGVVSAQPLSLAFKPVDVQYSKSLDRLVFISANPNKVHLVNPADGTDTTVNLSLAPLSLSVSPDGTHAAVGHDGWISYVNLSAGYVEKNLAVSLTANVVLLAGNGNIWVPPATSINVANGVQTSSSSSPYGTSHPALHPNGHWVYSTDDSSSPNILSKGDMASGTFQFLYIYPYWGDFPSCGRIFYSADSNRFLTGCGTFFRSTASKTDDMTYSGALSAASAVNGADDSLVTHKFAVMPGVGYATTTTDTELQFYDDQYLTLLGRVALPKYTSGSVSVPWHGRNVFYSPDSSKLYLVLQADPKANLTYDYAIYSLALSTGSGCGPSLSATFTYLPASGGDVNVTVTAANACLWQSSSNATWLNISAGGVSSGNGTVTIHAAPNLQTVSRQGTVAIAGLTYTVFQDAAAAAGTNPVSPSPVRPVAADYSDAMDRMILVSTNPDLLTILDPVTGSAQTVPLPMPPTALSISPDGLHAAVGHDALISYVDLQGASVEKTLPVTETVFELALSANNVYAFPLHDQWQPVRIVNIASGVETRWNSIYAGSTAGKISPNGRYLYINASKRYDITQPLPSAFDAISSNNPLQWFSQDGSRLYSGTGQVYRLSDAAAQDLQYNGRLETSGIVTVADSSTQQLVASVATGSTADTTIKFFGTQYLGQIGSIPVPKFTSGANSYAGHGRYLFWNAASNRLFAVIQADPASGLLNDYSIYTISLNGGCNTSLDNSNTEVASAGGTFNLIVSANAGCAWKATSSASWLTISANALSAGPATVSYIVDANPTTSARMGTITVDGKTLTVTQDAAGQVQVSALNALPFRVVDAEYSTALARIIALSGSPNRLNIYDPLTGANTSVTLPLPGNAVSVAPSGLFAAVCHDGSVSLVNLQSATITNSLNVSGSCYDLALADNGYIYLSFAGGWGTSSSVSIATGVETKADLLYNGISFRLNATGDALYTSNTGTSAASVTRYSISGGPMKVAYQSDWYPPHAFGYQIWFTRDGRMVGDSGSVFLTGTTKATDFVYTGTLSGFSGSIGSIVGVAHSTARHLFASIGPGASSTATTDKDTNLFLHGDKYYAVSSKMTLPQITVGGVSAKSHGKFVFWDSTGTKAHVILQADSSAGFLNDFAVYTLSPEFTPGCAVTLGASSATANAHADTGSVAVNAASSCIWEVKTNAGWIQIDSGTLGVGTGNVSYSVVANPNSAARTGSITIGTQTFTVTQAAGTVAAQPLAFVPVTPCRVADTRTSPGPLGGPSISGGTSRDFPLPSSACGIPSSAQAYALNVAAVPHGTLEYITVWPTGQTQPFVSTFNSIDGRIKTNLAIVPAGSFGAVSVFVTDTSDVVLDVSGYFIPATASTGSAFYPVAPCRIADTRMPASTFGGPALSAGETRAFPVPSSTCGIPPSAQAYSLNFTVVPQGPLGYLTAWPAGSGQPLVATVSAPTGSVVANAAITPAGTGGGINVFATDRTDVIIDVNGYFAAPGGTNALWFYPVTPCRVSDTRLSPGTFGGPSMAAGETRQYPITSSGCPIPTSAQEFALNATVLPAGLLGYLTLWPAGGAQPIVSTLNSLDGSLVSNAALVPAGSGGISAFVTNPTDLFLDINGYFAP